MKKQLILLAIAFIVKTSFSQAQIPNAGFEQLNFNGEISHWGSTTLFAWILDSLGHPVDSVVFDQQFYQPTNDAHTGLRAIEMRNAYDFTSNVGYAGRINSTTDTSYLGFSIIDVPLNIQPVNFGFYYKYFSVNNDSAMAQLTLWDSTYNQIGEALVIIPNSASVYTLATAQVQYTLSGTVAFYSLAFSTHYSLVPYLHQPSLGTRFLVDDVGFDIALGINESITNTGFKVYPNPVNDFIYLKTKQNSFTEIEITNLLGEVITKEKFNETLDVSLLPKGIYFIKLINKEKIEIQKFVKG